jgi:Domain of unknown function (DUF4352)
MFTMSPFRSPTALAGRLPAVLLLAALTAPAVAACGSVEEPSSGGAQNEQEGKTKKKAGIGAEVRDGKFAFTVTKVKPGVRTLGSGPLASKPQGQYVLIYVTVRNIGKEPQAFSDTVQKLVDSSGREYSAASGDAAVSMGDSNVLFNEINPGNKVKGILVYDVPKGTRLKSLELHDSAFSDGVKVSLAS